MRRAFSVEREALSNLLNIVLAVLLLAIFGAFLTVPKAHALQRCKQYAHDVKRFHNWYFGIDFPSEYSVAQLHKESLCRNHILSSDGIGSEGPAQITFRVWKKQLEDAGITEIKTIPNHLKAQAYINHACYEQAACKRLWVMYQIYNGGGLVNAEIARAGECDWTKAYRACKRRDIVFGNRQKRNACDINYEYSLKIYEIAEAYRGYIGQSRIYDAFGVRNSGTVPSIGGYEYW